MEYIVSILSTGQVTHDVRFFRVSKPPGFSFRPGEATDVSIHQPGLEQELRPFTFTSLNEDPYLEFTIKRYDDHHGITARLHQLAAGDELIVRDPWGAIAYKGEGYFIAGGAGITPFISILRDLHRSGKAAGNTLFFSNKTAADIIYHDELNKILGDRAHFICTKGNGDGCTPGRIDEDFLRRNAGDLSRNFYICGPDPMVSQISETLARLGAHADSVVFER